MPTHAGPSTRRSIMLSAAALLLSCGGATAQVNVGQLSHVAYADRRPLCPLNGEAFDVLFQTAAGNLTSARVLVDDDLDGVGVVAINATRQPAGATPPMYDLWRVSLPATAASRTGYIIELTDNADVKYLTPAGVVSVQPAPASWWTLDFTTLSHAPVGATPSTGGTVFRVWAPGATSAQVRGSFNAWGSANPMTKRGEYFYAVVPNAAPGSLYKYYFNNNLWKPDPRASYTNNADNFNCLVYNQLAYQWRTPAFTPVPRDRWVVYQLHVGTYSGLNDPAGSFTRQGNFRDVAARAAHLQELGITAVMLNPINEFPGSASGGYNSLSAWNWESTYGNPDDLKFMIDELHSRGIAVIADVVWNHVDANSNYLWNFDSTQVYFDTPDVQTPWGSQLNIDRAPVFDYFFESIEHALGWFKLDGYRQDAVAELVSSTQFQAGQLLIRGMNDQIDRRFVDSTTIGEIYNNSAWNTSPAGMNFDGQYHEAFKNAIADATFAAGAGDPDVSRVANSIDGSGAFVEGDKVLNYFELHDDAWPLNSNQRAVRDIDTVAPHDDRYASGRTKLANGLTLLSRGMPAILQGTEWLESNGWEAQKIDWSKKTTYRQVFDFYRDLIALRTAQPALLANAALRVRSINEPGNVFSYEREAVGSPAGTALYVVVANFSNVDYPEYLVGVPVGGASVVINSEAAAYRGRGVGSTGCLTVQPIARDGLPRRVNVSLPAHGFLLIKIDPGTCRADFNCTGGGTAGVTVQDIFDFLAAWFASSPQADFNGTSGVSVQDIFDYLAAWFQGC
jgi:1,4-alpha-glucan branching enzyme